MFEYMYEYFLIVYFSESSPKVRCLPELLHVCLRQPSYLRQTLKRDFEPTQIQEVRTINR